MKKIVLATVSVVALGSASALAADLGPRAYTKAPMMAAPVSSWQGFYIGGNVGYGWGSGNTDFSFLPSQADFGVANTSLNSNPQGVVGLKLGIIGKLASSSPASRRTFRVRALGATRRKGLFPSPP
jgi:opacity protein-like surface antigen